MKGWDHNSKMKNVIAYNKGYEDAEREQLRGNNQPKKRSDEDENPYEIGSSEREWWYEGYIDRWKDWERNKK
jgi:hypothetical protein